MIKVSGIKGKRFGVFGLGATGLAAARALSASGAEVYSWDENPEVCEKTANTEYRAERPVHWPWDQLSGVVLSPGVPFTHPKPHPIVEKARSTGVEIIGDMELFARVINAMPDEERPKIVAITGSNGKSTTTTLIAHILKETGFKVAEGGNLGTAVLDMPPPDEVDIYVLELSSFQLDLISSLAADIAVFLNISPDHLERHGGMNGYVAAKKRIFRNMTQDGTMVIGVDDPIAQSVCTEMIAGKVANVIPISARGTLGHGVFALSNTLYCNFDHKTVSAGALPDRTALQGKHNVQNAAAALAVVTQLGISPPVAIMAMAKFSGLPHRMEEVTRIRNIVCINDSKATNADAAAQALAAFEDIYWIAGGKAKETGIDEIDDALANVRTAYLYGEASRQFAKTLAGRINIALFDTLPEATRAALIDAGHSHADKPVVLLSPAAASYDQFRNFEHRGDVFRETVLQFAQAGGEAA